MTRPLQQGQEKTEDDRMNVPSNQISDVREVDVATPKTSAKEAESVRADAVKSQRDRGTSRRRGPWTKAKRRRRKPPKKTGR